MNVLRDINPVTRILGLALLTTPLMFTIDWVSATFVLAFTVVMVPLCGLSYGRFLKRALPILLVAPLAEICELAQRYARRIWALEKGTVRQRLQGMLVRSVMRRLPPHRVLDIGRQVAAALDSGSAQVVDARSAARFGSRWCGRCTRMRSRSCGCRPRRTTIRRRA